MHEFDLIKNLFAPLSHGFSGGLNLTDDAAVLDIPAGKQLVVTKDALVARVHFFGDEDAAMIARKALRVNLSDLAAMGAQPHCYFLALMLPKDTPHDWIARFCEGLAIDQKEFDIHLAGGDTTATPGPLSLSITAMGLVDSGKALRRNGAKAGDGVYVSGTIGDSALGLALLRGKLDSRLRGNDKEFLEHRYLLPQPRLALGRQLIGVATSCMDISDGLMQDLGHICTASGVGAIIERGNIPLSDAAKNYLRELGEAGGQQTAAPAARLMQFSGENCGDNLILDGGDDYELLFTVPPEKEHLLPQGITKIGTITEGNAVLVDGKPSNTKGYKHF